MGGSEARRIKGGVGPALYHRLISPSSVLLTGGRSKKEVSMPFPVNSILPDLARAGQLWGSPLAGTPRTCICTKRLIYPSPFTCLMVMKSGELFDGY